MELNVQAIADEKIQSMHESGEIRQRIEEGISKTVLGAIDDALTSWELKRNIEKSVSDNVSSIVKEIGFSGYNGFIAKTIKDITENVMRDDVAQKIQKVFNDMLIVKHDGIKLSEIFNKYREYVLETTEEADKWEYQNFTCDLDISDEDSLFKHYIVKFKDQDIGTFNNPDIEFRMTEYKDSGKASIYILRFNGHSIDKDLSIGTLNPIESLLANLYFNKTEIVLDVEDVDEDDNGYDIDC